MKTIEIPTNFWISDFFTIEEKHTYINYLCEAQQNHSAYLDDILRAKMENNGFLLPKKNNIDILIRQVFDSYETVFGKHRFRFLPQRKKTIKSLLVNYTVQDIVDTWVFMKKKWGNDPKNVEHLNLDTLTGINFDKYYGYMKSANKIVSGDIAHESRPNVLEPTKRYT